MHFRSLAAAALTVASAVVAQAGTRFLPPKPMFVLEMDGPKKLAERFDGTNLAAMMQSQEMGAWLDRVVGELEQEMEDAPAEARAMWAELRTEFERYAGRATLAVQIEPGEDGLEGEPELLLTLSLAPDDNVDLEGVASRFREKVYDEEGVRIQTATIGDGSEVEIVEGGELRVMLPRLVDGHLVFAAGELDPWLAELGTREGGEADEPRDGFRVSIEHELFALLPELIRSSSEFEVQMIADALGPLFEMLEGTQSASMSVRPAAEFAILEMQLEYDPTRPSFADFVAPPGDARVGLIDLAPRTDAGIATMSVNVGRVLDFVEDIVESAGEDFGEAEMAFTEFTGARLREDFVDLLDGTLLVVEQDPTDDFEDVATTFVIGVKDTAALEQTVEGALRKRGLHAGRKTEEYRGVDVRRLNLGFFELSWVFTDGALMVSVGSDDGRGIRRLIDGGEDRKAGLDPAPWPEHVRARLAHAGQGWHWLAVSDARGEVEALQDSLEGEVAAIDEVPAEILELLADLLGIMDKFDMLTSVTSTTFERGRVVSLQVF